MKQKLMIVLIINLIILFCISATVLAIDTSQYEPTSPLGYTEFTNIGGNIISVIQYVGIILGAIALTIIGIKYMLGSVEEKAEYKQTMMPYIVGCIFLMSSSAFVGIIANSVGNDKSTEIPKSPSKPYYTVTDTLYWCSNCDRELTEEEKRDQHCSVSRSHSVTKKTKTRYYCTRCDDEWDEGEKRQQGCDQCRPAK